MGYVHLGRVGNDGVVTGRNHDHGKGVGENRLMILTGEGQRTKLWEGKSKKARSEGSRRKAKGRFGNRSEESRMFRGEWHVPQHE